MSIARTTLGRARFFLKRGREIDPTRREELQHFVDAAIVFGRSVTFHLQKEFGHRSEFDSWYEGEQEKLREDSAAKFLLERRNYILKEGPIRLGRAITVSINASVAASAFIETRVVRAKPWYRRPPRTLWQDCRDWTMRPIRRWRRERAGARTRRARSVKGRTKTKVEEVLRFDHDGWRDRSAFDVIEMYLKQLDQIVSDAERRFSKPKEDEERS